MILQFRQSKFKKWPQDLKSRLLDVVHYDLEIMQLKQIEVEFIKNMHDTFLPKNIISEDQHKWLDALLTVINKRKEHYPYLFDNIQSRLNLEYTGTYN